MNFNEYIDLYEKTHKLNGLRLYARCSGINLEHKKILIHVLRDKLRLSFSQIGRLFKNEHGTVFWHYNSAKMDAEFEKKVEDAWKLYRP